MSITGPVTNLWESYRKKLKGIPEEVVENIRISFYLDMFEKYGDAVPSSEIEAFEKSCG